MYNLHRCAPLIRGDAPKELAFTTSLLCIVYYEGIMRGSFDTPMSVAGVGGWVPNNRARMRHNLEDGCLASSDGFGAGGHPGVNLSQPGRSFPEPQ